jgi:hypothetical protein
VRFTCAVTGSSIGRRFAPHSNCLVVSVLTGTDS